MNLLFLPLLKVMGLLFLLQPSWKCIGNERRYWWRAGFVSNHLWCVREHGNDRHTYLRHKVLSLLHFSNFSLIYFWFLTGIAWHTPADPHHKLIFRFPAFSWLCSISEGLRTELHRLYETEIYIFPCDWTFSTRCTTFGVRYAQNTTSNNYYLSVTLDVNWPVSAQVLCTAIRCAFHPFFFLHLKKKFSIWFVSCKETKSVDSTVRELQLLG